MLHKITPTLKMNDAGEEVVNLQDALRLLVNKDRLKIGDPATEARLLRALAGERERQVFGHKGTLPLVKLFQTQQHLEPSGQVDAATADALNELLEELGELDDPTQAQFLVQGQVQYADGQLGAGMLVRAFDRDLRSEERLGEVTTDKQGRYIIKYFADHFRRAENRSADLRVAVCEQGGRELATSGIQFNAPAQITIDLTLPSTECAPSEFARYLATMEPLQQGLSLIELKEDTEHQDFTFLAGDTGIPRDRIAFLVKAAALEEASPQAAARATCHATCIPAMAFYGWFRQGLPTSLPDLLAQDTRVLREALERSGRENIIRALSGRELDEIINDLAALKASLILKPADTDQPASLGDLLGTTQLSPVKQRSIAELQVEHGGETEEFWMALNERTDFSEEEIGEVRLTLQLGKLTAAHMPLILELRQAAPADRAGTAGQELTIAQLNANELRPFAGLDTIGWKEILMRPQAGGQPIGAPPTTPGADAKEKIDNYAIALNQFIENVLPTAVVASRVDKDTGDDSPFKPVKADLKTFFNNNPWFEFGAIPVEVYLAEGRDSKLSNVTDPTALMSQLKIMRRIFNLTPRYQEIRALLADKLHSAYAIASLGERRFTEKYAASLGGPSKALELFRKAEQVHGTALNVFMKYDPGFNSPLPYVIGGGRAEREASSDDGIAGNLTAAMTRRDMLSTGGFDWRTLFGSLDMCDCEHCKSLYSPAAYLVDIMKYLDNAQKVGAPSPLQALLGRRPDIEHIELTCENTNTQLPYIDLVNEILEAAIAPRTFQIAEGEDINAVLSDLRAGRTPDAFETVFKQKGYSLTVKASVRTDKTGGVESASKWMILDSGWAFELVYQGTNEGFRVAAWPQTSWTSDESRANPEHVHDPAYNILRDAVYPWILPLNLPVEEMRIYLGHLGASRNELMETFFKGASIEAICDKSIAKEKLGLTAEEAKITTGATPTRGHWDFWGLSETGNDIADPTDFRLPNAQGDWDIVLRRVSIFLLQSGLSYRELLELLGSYFINPLIDGVRMIGIVSNDSADPATCQLGKLEIRVQVEFEDASEQDVLIRTWNKIHRFVRLWRKLGWTMRDLDKTLAALTPNLGWGDLDITEDFLVGASHIQRLQAILNVPLVNMLSWWADIDTASYIDHLAEGQPEVNSLYKQLFRNKTVIKPLDEAFTEDAGALADNISEHLPALVAAFGVNAADLALLTAGAASVIADDNLNLSNLSKLYRVISLARALKLTIPQYLSIRKLSGVDPFAPIPANPPADQLPATAATLLFVEKVKALRASGFSIEELNYLLRHDFRPLSTVALSEDQVAAILDEIRAGLQQIAAENTIHEDPSDPEGVTVDPVGEVTRKKLASLNWDGGLIEELLGAINGTVTYEALTDTFLTGLDLPNDTGVFEVDLPSLPNGFAFPDELAGVVTTVPKFLFACDAEIPVESTAGNISDELNDKFAEESIDLGNNPAVTIETTDTIWRINGRYSVVKNGGILSVNDLEDRKLRASRLLSGSERNQLQDLAAGSNDNGLIIAIGNLIDLQDQLQGRITYDQVMVNGQPKGRLRFAGPMTNARKAMLDGVSTDQDYLDAVQELYDAPRKFIGRYARAFSPQDFSTELAALPDRVKFPNALLGKVYFDAAAEPIRLHFVGVMTERQRDLLLGLSSDPNDQRHGLYVDAVNALFAQPESVTATFLTAPGPGTDAAEMFDDPTNPGERFLVALRKLLPYLRRTLSEHFVAQTVAEALEMETKTSSNLLTKWVNSPTHPAQKSISELLAPVFIESNLRARLTTAAFPDQFKAFTLLHKISLLVIKLKITSGQVDWLFENGNRGGWLDLNALPVTPMSAQDSSKELFTGWERLVELFRLRNVLPLGEMGLFDLFDLALAAAASNLDDDRNAAKQIYLEKMSERTLWQLEDLEVLLGAGNEHTENGILGFAFPDDYIDERKLFRLLECFKLMKRLGGSAAQLGDWAKSNQTAAEELENAIAIKNAVKAKYDNKQWLEVAKPLRDQLRRKQRDALVAFLVTHPDPVRGWNWHDADGLYEHFLIDVEMDSCMLTTRIKQAISSVQLFIQRCLMNLESGVHLAPEDAQQWTRWRKWYRVWEANRKVLFYTENWLDPGLLYNESPFLKELKDELLQGDVNMDTAEDAFLHYLEKLEQVARLEIVGIYYQEEPQNILHVFGRTYSMPHVYFYRRLEANVWSAWEKVDLDIEGDHLIPVVWNRHLYLFWAIFTEKQETHTKQQRLNNDDSAKYWEIKLAWSEYKNAKWSPKKISRPLKVDKFPYPGSNPDTQLKKNLSQEPKDFSFKTRILREPGGEQLNIECYGPFVIVSEVEQPPPPPPVVPFVTIPGTQLNPHDILGARLPTYAKFSVLVDGRQPTAAERGNIKIKLLTINSSGNGAGPVTGREFETLNLNTNGNAYSTIPFSQTITWNLNSKGFRLVSSEDGGSWTFFASDHIKFFSEAVNDALADAEAAATNASEVATARVARDLIIQAAVNAAIAAGGLPGASASAAITAVLLAAPPFIAAGGAVAAVANAAVSAIQRTFGRRVTIRLKTLPVPKPPEPVTIDVGDILPMRAKGQFALDDCSGDLVTLGVGFPLMIPFQLQAPAHTQIQNMMIEEFPFDYTLSLTDGGDPILDRTPGVFRLLAPHQDSQFTPQSPFFFQDGQRTYFVSNEPELHFAIHSHPLVCDLVKALKRYGIPGLLTLENQLISDSGTTFMTRYSPKPRYEAPKEDIDFEPRGAYSLYNWELFFHAPFLIATQLSKNQRFEEAQKWFHYIVNPTATDSPLGNPGSPGVERFWRVKPFYDEAMRDIQTLEELIADAGKINEQVEKWSADPFNPHLIARTRVVAYMKAVVMSYIDNLIAWGDQLFRRDTLESINEATQLYVLAAKILGRRPENIPPRARAKLQTFRTLDDKTDAGELNSLSNAVVEIESFIPPSSAPTSGDGTQGGALLMPFFCIMPNDKLLGYWDTVADRLFKIRHCLNIEGVERSLPPFEPAIDPGLLVRAAAAGVDVASVLNDMNAAVPPYRFNVMLPKATELCNDVKALGGALLSALEKKDAEELALLRSSHELELLKAIREVKRQQVEEAKNTLAGLIKYQDVVTARQQYYLSRPFMNQAEISHMSMMADSLIPMAAHMGAELTAAILHLVPNTKAAAPTSAGVTYGGDNIASAVQAFGSSAGTMASMISTGASLSATLGGYQRRQDDWTHQADLATKELEQAEKQIVAAEIRVAIAEHELENHELQTENANEIDEYMRHRKFTNQELYSWMVGKLSGIYFQGYQLAYDVAKRAERAYRHELGLKDSNFIQFGYWDSLKKGLLSGERLHQDLKRMDVAYLDQNKREYEITKHISLITLDPISLIKLKQTGECSIALPEALFDIDYPGHYMRRLKSVSITIPCVTGPYAGVNCTLTQLSGSIRHANTLPANKYSRKGDDTRFSDSFGAIQSIVTSSGQNDSGLFEANMRDERYLPFEGQGAISTWRIQLPTQFKPFDYDTISDVVLHLRYTAREGGTLLRQRAVAELSELVDSFTQPDGQQGLARIFSLRHEFPTEWRRFLNPTTGDPEGQTLTMALTRERFPFLVQDRISDIDSMELLVKIKPEFSVSHNDSTLKLSLQAGTAASNNWLTLSTWSELLRTAESPGGELGNWTLTAWLDAGGGVNQRVEPDAIQDILLVCRYTCS